MATSFLPDTVDASQQNITSENIIPVPMAEVNMLEQELEVDTENSLPIDALEGHPDKDEHFLEENNDAPEIALPTPHIQKKYSSSAPPKPIPQLRDPFVVQIEKIMEENLGDVFGALTPVQKQQFKIKGEETARKIYSIVQTTSAKLGRIIKLIFEWLKILPGINHFFLEQEAKIKAEKIIALSTHKKHIS